MVIGNSIPITQGIYEGLAKELNFRKSQFEGCMAWPKWKKRLAWCLTIPASLTVIGWVGMNVAEARLDAAIRSEEISLEAMGLHVKPLTPADDAAPLYKAALEKRATMSTESFLKDIERAASKPAYLAADFIASPLPGGTRALGHRYDIGARDPALPTLVSARRFICKPGQI